MPDPASFPLAGGCACGKVRYRILTAPLVVHACHCRRCQRQTGTAFAVNALIEADRVEVVGGSPVSVDVETDSGKGQRIWRCPTCQVAVWSNYLVGGAQLHFVRVGTLDDPDAVPPDIHIYTASKLPWVVIPEGARAAEAYYRASEVWSPESLERREALRKTTPR